MIDPTKAVTIDLIVDGKRLGMRQWHHVPRVGDMILIMPDNSKTVSVDAVIWSEAGDDRDIYDCWVQLICTEIEHVVGKNPKKKERRK